jgi:hypothetical protein
MNKAICILAPSFVIAAIAEIVFVAIFDPIELHLVARVLGVSSRVAWYLAGFLLFWVFAAAASLLSHLMFVRAGAGHR